MTTFSTLPLCLFLIGLFMHSLHSFGFPFYFLTQCGNYCSVFLFVQPVFTFFLNFFESISIMCRLHENINLLSPLAHGFYIYQTKKIVVLNDAAIDKRERKTLQRLHEPPEYSSKNSCWNIRETSVTKNPEFMPEFSEIFEPSHSSLIDKSQFKRLEPENIVKLPSTFCIK